jgi:hypothetical protein
MKLRDKAVKTWHRIIQVLMSFVHTFRVYPGWARLYRFLRQRKYVTTDLPVGLSPQQAQEEMDSLEWQKDTWREAWDSVGSPQWVQHCINEIAYGREQPKGALDCDDFSSWAVNVIDGSWQPLFFGQGWAPRDERGRAGFKVTGHAVCVVEDPTSGELWHCGNWGLIGPFQTLRDVGNHISGNSRGLGKPIAWCLYSPDMRLIDKGNGLPPQTKPSSI